MIVDLDRKWIGRAACAGLPSGTFFIDHATKALESPTAKVQAQWDQAKKVCATCPVLELCARDSLGEIDGVWGGLDPAERQRLRVANSQRVRRMSDVEKQEWAETAYHLNRQRGMPFQDVARVMGVSIQTCKHLSELHAEKIMEEAKSAKDTIVPDKTVRHVPWPKVAPSEGDGWVQYCGRVVRGYYLGQTADDEWIFMKVPLSKEYSSAWFKAEDVKILRRLQRKTLRRAGETSRIYGTTISNGQRQKAG